MAGNGYVFESSSTVRDPELIRSSCVGPVLVAIAAAAVGCTYPTLRPRSTECTLTTIVGAPCQPLDRASIDADADAKRFATVADKANVYIVRPSLLGGRYLWDIQFDGRHAGLIAEHTYLLLVVPPGTHVVSVQTGENRHAITVDAKAGANHFVEVTSRMGWTQSKAEMREIRRDAGEAVVRESRLAEKR